MSGIPLFALQYSEINEVTGFIPFDVYVGQTQIRFNRIYKASKPFVEFNNVMYHQHSEGAIQTL
jgi:hypothetical protein